ncbi:MAG: hypothetical protein JRI26_10475 [Deltaproteobacteria bacterium]|nr:hypothetical protein [Deltaproteobacteria bacterium]
MYELLPIDKELSLLIDKEVELDQITERAKEKGFVDIFDITVAKVKQGITTVEDAVRTMGHLRQASS